MSKKQIAALLALHSDPKARIHHHTLASLRRLGYVTKLQTLTQLGRVQVLNIIANRKMQAFVQHANAIPGVKVQVGKVSFSLEVKR